MKIKNKYKLEYYIINSNDYSSFEKNEYNEKKIGIG